MSALIQYCTFLVDGLQLGMAVERVQEVIRHQELTRVPLAPRVISGLINLRGQIVLAIDLRRCLELPDLPPGATPMNVVLRTQFGPLSLLVDQIADVVAVDESTRQNPPETLRGSARRLIQAAYPLPNRLLLGLDPSALVQMSVSNPS
jgi:purine-binding chemotaxis protein CheW